MGFKQALRDTKVEKPESKKVATIPVLQDAPESIQADATTYLAKVKAKKNLEAKLASLNEALASYVRTEQDVRALKGHFSNSYKIPTLTTDFLTVTTKSVFKIKLEDAPAIKQLFGSKYDEMIEEKLEIVLKPEIFENKKLQKELIAALGVAGFKKFFDTFTSLKVKEDFDERIYRYAATFKKPLEKLAEIRAIIEPSKSTLK